MAVYRILRFNQPAKFRVKFMAVALAIGLAALWGCSHREKVLIPPKMNLSAYRTIGVIDFSANAKDDLSQYVTQRYIQSVQAAQPGVRFLELGRKKQVLAKVGRTELDPEVIKIIGSAYDVDALVFGNLSVSEPKPNISLSSTWESMRAGADIEASLMTKLWETASGVTLWTKSSKRIQSVASLSADTSGNINFGASDPQDAYGNLVPNLVYVNTADFRSHYEYRKVK